MKYIKLFESKDYEELDLTQFRKEFNDGDSDSSSRIFKVTNFERFTDNELAKLKSLFSRFNGYFAHTNNDNPLFMHTIFDSNEPELFRNVDGFRPVHDKKIPSLVYGNGGKTEGSQKQFFIGKLEDDWFIVMVKEMVKAEGKKDPWVKFKGITKYYKCDQFGSLISLLKEKTKAFKTYSQEDAIQKGDRTKKLNQIVYRLKELSWDEFNKFYDEFIKR
jgi:hypothetical protein